MTSPTDARRMPATLSRPRADERRFPRLFPDRPLLCHLQPADRAEATAVAAAVHDLSASGIAVLTSLGALAGDRFRLLLVNAAAVFCVVRTLTVVRCQRHPCGCILAGQFDEPLSTEELRPFLV